MPLAALDDPSDPTRTHVLGWLWDAVAEPPWQQ